MAASDSLQDIAKSLNNLVPFHNEAPQTLSEFTCFPNLPLELRLVIFEYDLTNDDREFKIWIFRDRSKTKQRTPRNNVRLVYAPDRKEEAKENHVALLATCNESRSVALKVFKHTLPAYHGGFLRFSDRTIFTFANIYSAVINESICPNVDIFTRKRRIFRKIKSDLFNVKRFGVDCPSNVFYVLLSNDVGGFRKIISQVILTEIILVDWENNFRPGEARTFLKWKTRKELVDKVSNHLQHGPLGMIRKITYLGWRKDDE